MKALHVWPRYSPSIGGSENYGRVISEHFAGRGHAVTVLTTTAVDHDALYTPTLRHAPETDQDLNAVRVVRRAPDFANGGGGSVAPPSFKSAGIAAYVDILAPGDHDIVNVAGFPFVDLIGEAARAAGRLQCPLLVTPFIHTHPELASVFQTRPLREAVHRADTVICQTVHEAEFLAACWGLARSRLEVIGVGVDIAPATYPRQRPGTTMMLYLGTLDRLKGASSVLDAGRRLDGSGVDLVLAGQPTPAFARELATAAALPAGVELKGRVDEAAKDALLGSMTALVVPSAAESFGQVYLEAWQRGKPVIAARGGATECIVKDGENGTLVDFGNVDQLEAAILAYARDPGLCRDHGEAGYRTSLEYLWPRVLARLERVYGSLLRAV